MSFIRAVIASALIRFGKWIQPKASIQPQGGGGPGPGGGTPR